MLTQAELKSQLHYDADTGLFTWLRSFNNIKIGRVAGTLNSNGHVQIKIFSKLNLLHRLAFLYMNGGMPEKGMELDHINGIKTDNRWCNLRLSTRAQNQHNAKRRVDNTSSVKGVHWCKRDKKFIARCWLNGKRHILGYFDDLESATKARQDFAKVNHGEFYREA